MPKRIRGKRYDKSSYPKSSRRKMFSATTRKRQGFGTLKSMGHWTPRQKYPGGDPFRRKRRSPYWMPGRFNRS